MWPQIAVIIWAQWRTFRNHLPRIGLASVLGNVLSFLWYALFLSAAVAIAVLTPQTPVHLIAQWLPAILLGFCAVWQLVPLFTLSSGWSLQLSKLQIYPLRTEALFGIEVLLRVTASPEVILLLLGGTAGLLLHPGISLFRPVFLLLLLPMNLLLSLAIRELVLHSFERNRFREIFSIVLISVALLPQWVLRSEYGSRALPYLTAASHAALLPWSSAAALITGPIYMFDLVTLLFWLGASYGLARWFFVRSLRFEETPQAGSLALIQRGTSAPGERRVATALTKFLKDPLAALVQKELQSLIRMPRFRVAFGMACIFSVLILLPMTINSARAGFTFLQRNFLPFVSLYGLLILSDSLLLNVFGTDRAAVALYYAAPVSIRTVIQAKNLTAVMFLGAQAAVVLVIAGLVHGGVQIADVATALGGVAVVGIFFISIGNLTSVILARPSDPRQTMRKAAGGKLQLWLMLCMLAMGLLLGAAYLAQSALDSAWALFGVLGVEFVIGLIVYRVALDSAIEHAERDREKMVDALSKGVGLTGSSA